MLRSCVLDTMTKMIYAAACDVIKRALDLTRFAPNYHVVDAEDLMWSDFSAWSGRSDRAGAMTAAERSAVADIREQVQEGWGRVSSVARVIQAEHL